jgi:hypothetical protein
MAPIDLACPHQPRPPPPASLAPMLCRRPSLGTDARLQAPVLAVGMEVSFSLFRIEVHSFLSL